MSRIALIDDNELQLKRGKLLLEHDGHEVSLFQAGEEALQTLLVHHFDLIIVDVYMPVHSGFDLMRSLRLRANDTPVIFISSRSQQSVIGRALKLGAEDFIVKPIDDDLFRAKVSSVLEKYRPKSTSSIRFAKVKVQAAATLRVPVTAISISELGFQFEANWMPEIGSDIDLDAECFEEMGIANRFFRVASVKASPKDSKFRYSVNVSFVGLTQRQMTQLRLWIKRRGIEAFSFGTREALKAS